MGIEPTYSAWKAAALPLSYTRERQFFEPAPRVCNEKILEARLSSSCVRIVTAISVPIGCVQLGELLIYHDDDKNARHPKARNSVEAFEQCAGNCTLAAANVAANADTIMQRVLLASHQTFDLDPAKGIWPLGALNSVFDLMNGRR